MFDQNKYTIWYNIMKSRQKNEISSDIYSENHHIIPKSMGGNDKKDNLVRLLPREHFLAHWLLTKMCTTKNHEIKMKHALSRMMHRNNITTASNWSKWQYEINAKVRSQVMRDRAVNGTSPNQGKKHTPETKEKMRLAKLGVKRDPSKIGYLKTRKHTEETKKKIGNSLKGRIFSEESRLKTSNTQKGKPQNKTTMICIHCGNENYATQIKRYHNDNCKSKELIDNGN